jgi:hypothetical protein
LDSDLNSGERLGKLMKSLFCFSIIFLCTISTLASDYVGVSLEDILEFAPEDKQIIGLQSIVESLTDGEKVKNFSGLDQLEIEYSALGGMPINGTYGSMVPILIYAKDKDGRFLFKKYNVSLSPEGNVRSVRLNQSTDLDHSNFSIFAHLKGLQLELRDKENDIALAFPVGAGAFAKNPDLVAEGEETDIMTYSFPEFCINPKWTISKRWKPRYFKGKPFVRFGELPDGYNDRPGDFEDVGYSDQGFHIKQNREFQRGFLSHGCIRMREKDLNTLHSIVRNGPQDLLKGSMELTQSARVHPYPFAKQFSYAVPGQKDKDGLTLTRRVYDQYPPVEKLPDPDQPFGAMP